MGYVVQFVKILLNLLVLCLFYYIGMWIQQFFHLIIPGSIIGMLLLFIALLTKRVKPKWINHGANLLVSHLALLFVPVTVGVINYFNLFGGKGILLIPIALGSTILVIVSSGWVSQYLGRKKVKEVE